MDDGHRKMELPAAEDARTRMHDTVISCYNILAHYCRRHRNRGLSVEVRFSPDTAMAVIGDLAMKVRLSLD